MIDDLKSMFKDYKPYINGADEMKRASVLIPIVKKDDEHYILFELRSGNLNHQPGEISFPGGKIEPDETPYDAAIRETCEELGTTKNNIEIISEMDLLITSFNYIIHPFLGYLKDVDNFNINKDEVDHTFLVPVKFLLENPPKEYTNEVEIIPSDNMPYIDLPNQKDYKFQKGKSSILFYKYNNYIIWGMTAKILQNFLKFLID
nr:CoA pyrophosphatase [Clostridioides sp.]